MLRDLQAIESDFTGKSLRNMFSQLLYSLWGTYWVGFRALIAPFPCEHAKIAILLELLICFFVLSDEDFFNDGIYSKQSRYKIIP